jgi:hypothetical protein
MHHRLRDAHLVARAATVVIDPARLVTPSFLHVPGRPWEGCGQTLALPSLALRKTDVHLSFSLTFFPVFRRTVDVVQCTGS